ncbi:MAG: four-carbon acid sugar kinase family protein [Lachnospiraceae bacterium]|nr:four-carbon acid sugar kinase family protein [Lachnospiraceae bacterium]
MTKLLIIADDLTGALDTGVMFVKAGADVRVSVLTDPGDPSIREEKGNCRDTEKVFREADEVLVIDAETRHLEPDQAYRIVFEIVQKARKQGVSYIYKKTDSALRGNIGAELSAALRASKENVLHFLPAFPEMERYTKDGIHYIKTVPVAESVFGSDPFNPVENSEIREIIAGQSDIPVVNIPFENSRTGNVYEAADGNRPFKQTAQIRVYDISSKEQLSETARRINESGSLRVMAGCAGFAEELPALLGLGRFAETAASGAEEGVGTFSRDVTGRPSGKAYGEVPGKRTVEGNGTDTLEGGFLVVCGSVNPITVAQLDYAEKSGFRRIRLNIKEKLERGYWKSDKGRERLLELKKEVLSTFNVILDSNEVPGGTELSDYIKETGLSFEELRTGITEGLGELLAGLLDEGVRRTLMVVGGDTLLGFLRKAEISSIRPLREVKSGTVLTEIERGEKRYRLIAKSGGFGDEKLLAELSGL